MTSLNEAFSASATGGWPLQRHCTVRVRHSGDEKLYVAGEFNGWQLPGIPMERGESDTWEVRIPLLSADVRRFACFVLKSCGFRGIPIADVEISEATPTIQMETKS